MPDEPQPSDMATELLKTIIDEHATFRSQAFDKIIEIVEPFVSTHEVVRPLPIRFINEQPQSQHLQIAIDRNGNVEIRLLPRVKTPEPNTLVIPPDEDKEIDLTKR